MDEDDFVCFLDAMDGDTRLHLAAAQGNVTKLRDYFTREPKMYASNINRRVRPLDVTPLRLAVCRIRISAVKFLLSHGADIDIPDRKGQTALYHAVLQGSLECVRILLEAGSSPDGSPLNRTTPVFASMYLSNTCPRQYEICKTLLRYGGNFEQDDGNILQCTLCQILSTNDKEFFLTMYYEFGGSLRQCVCQKNFANRVRNEALASKLKEIMNTPLTLKSASRIAVRKLTSKTSRFHYGDDVTLPKSLVNYLNHV